MKINGMAKNLFASISVADFAT